ncbi:hypothetical protein [Halorarum halobium]|uniref:EMC6-like membrane protein n=1 Tax=Halorarum halobium TaxID=3075121 RepID=UPI0028AEDC5D|nr:hypothetical protein [Halobaculum sp. XH14]
MSTETASGLSDHKRGVAVTTVACLTGVAAAFISASVFGLSAETAASTQPLLVLAGLLFAEYPIMKLLGVAVEDFGIKDNLYVGFMTFTLWFISYGVLLSTTLAGSV